MSDRERFGRPFEADWTPARIDEAWRVETARRLQVYLPWVVYVLIVSMAALLVTDLVGGYPLVAASRAAGLLASILALGMLRARRPMMAMRTIMLGDVVFTTIVIAYVLSVDRRAESILAMGVLFVAAAPVGRRWTMAVAALMTLGAFAVTPPGSDPRHYINAVMFPFFAALARILIEGVDRGAVEARLRVEWARSRERALLYELMPAPIAEEFIETGSVAPRTVLATVVFVDVVGFSAASSKVRPVDLIETLEGLFTSFDRIVARYDLVKVKTLGDGYLFAGGLLSAGPQLAETLRAALDIVAAAEAHTGCLGATTVRAGVHHGEVVAGVIGQSRPNFDIWGDAVNVAARVEQLGDPGAVVVSEAVRQRLPEGFAADDAGVRLAKHGLQLRLYRLRPEPAGAHADLGVTADG